MKRIPVTALFLLFGAGLAFSLDGIEAPLLERLGIPQEDIERIEEIRYDAQKTVRAAQAELEIYRARLKKLLLDAQADLREVEALLREAMSWELKIRLTQIEQELKIRRLLGEENWDKLVRALRARKQRGLDLPDRPEGEKMKDD
jgi:Spy/CpxP family protein refolding chaperone